MKRTLTLMLTAVSLLSVSACEYRQDNAIPYRTGDNVPERCKLDVYYPDDAKECPVVVFFHGGGLTGGDRYIPENLKEAGLIVVTASYRLLPQTAIDDVIDDAAAAVAWTFGNIARYGGDADKIYLTGHSAGGYLIDLVGLDRQWLAKYGIDADRVAALAPLSGQIVTHYAVRNLSGLTPTQIVVDKYAPLTHIRADAPPILIISADREKELYGRYEEQAYFWRMLQLVGHKSATLYELDGFDHGGMAEPGCMILRDYIHSRERRPRR